MNKQVKYINTKLSKIESNKMQKKHNNKLECK